MALTVVKRPLGFSADGLPVEVATTSTVSSLIHIATSSTLVLDEVFVFASMDQTQTTAMTLNFIINSQTYSVDVPIRAVNYPILAGFTLWGQASASNGNRIEFFGSSTANLFLHGYVNRITET